MSRGSTLILFGLLTVAVPFSGLPIAARSFFLVVFGVCVVSIGVSIRTRDARVANASVVPIPEAPRSISSI